MAFSDPQVVTIAAAAKNLARIDSGKGYSEYYLGEATQSFSMFIRSAKLKYESDGRRKFRHNISLRQTVFATVSTPEVIREASFTITRYEGDDPAAFDDVGLAIAAIVTAPNVVKLNNFES